MVLAELVAILFLGFLILIISLLMLFLLIFVLGLLSFFMIKQNIKERRQDRKKKKPVWRKP